MTDFNLVDAEWIPCLMSNGEFRQLGIRAALTVRR